MQFQSYVFVFGFLPIVFILYSLTRTNILSKWVIVVSSVIFYGWEEPWFVVPMAATGLVDYLMAKKIAASRDERYRKIALVASLCFNLSLMSFFKYTGWLTDSLVALGAYTGFALMTAPLHVPLPPGVSFYTFESMSYTIDVYKDEFRPRNNLLDYFGFLVFFPHLVAGPIRRANQLVPVLSAYRPAVTAEIASSAIFMILFGLFQKLVLADNFGALVETTLKFIDPQTQVMPPGLGLIFTYAFCFQIYCDFAAYSIIARGTARLFGVELAHNFLTPYFSTNPSEFWSRWHISLSSWLRDYLYIPLGGNRGTRLDTLRNLLLTMFLAGLWHGAGIFFIVWGIYHGLLLILYRFIPIDGFLIRRLGRLGAVISAIVFFHFVCFGWIFFRASPEQFIPICRSIAAAPFVFVEQLSPWVPYLGKALNVPATLRSYVPYLFQAWHHGNELPATLADLLNALWHRHIVALPDVIWRSIYQSLQLNNAFAVWGRELAVLTLPLLLTDALGYRAKGEFPDLFPWMPWLLKMLVIVVLIYGIQFFGRREGNAFIYFAF